MAYIAPNRDRVNLTIESGVTARRLVMNGARAVGVEVERSGSIETFDGRRDRAVCRRRHVAAFAVAVRRRPGSLSCVATASRWSPICRVWALIAATTRRCSSASRRHGSCRARAGAGIVEVALDTIVDGAPVSLMPYLAPMAELVPGSAASATELVIGVLLERAANTDRGTRCDPTILVDAPTIEYHSLESTADRARLRGAVEIALSILD